MEVDSRHGLAVQAHALRAISTLDFSALPLVGNGHSARLEQFSLLFYIVHFIVHHGLLKSGEHLLDGSGFGTVGKELEAILRWSLPFPRGSVGTISSVTESIPIAAQASY